MSVRMDFFPHLSRSELTTKFLFNLFKLWAKSSGIRWENELFDMACIKDATDGEGFQFAHLANDDSSVNIPSTCSLRV